jgi:hypothetical protein
MITSPGADLEFLRRLFRRDGLLHADESPDFLFRLVQAVTPPSFVFSWVRFLTAPLRALSPTGLFTATVRFPGYSKRELRGKLIVPGIVDEATDLSGLKSDGQGLIRCCPVCCTD